MANDDYASWAGRTLMGSDGSKIGTIDQLYADKDSGEPTFVTVSTGLFGSKTQFVPISQGSAQGDNVTVPYSKEQVKDAPGVDPDGEITPEEEQQLYRHYGLTAPSGGYDEYETTTTTTTGGGYDADGGADVGADTGAGYVGDRGTVGHDTSGPTTDDAMTRSEERLRVGTERVQTGRARLRKYVVTENVSQTVPVSHEEIRIEREPITDANRGNALSGPDISEEEHEVTLTEERPVVAKETVPVERVRVDKETVTEQVEVNETLRKEQIEIEGAEDTGRTGYTGGTTGTRGGSGL